MFIDFNITLYYLIKLSQISSTPTPPQKKTQSKQKKTQNYDKVDVHLDRNVFKKVIFLTRNINIFVLIESYFSRQSMLKLCKIRTTLAVIMSGNYSSAGQSTVTLSSPA